MKKLYIENSVGRGVVEAFNKFTKHHLWTATFQHDVHPEMQKRQEEGDCWWIEDVTRRGFAIVSCDLAIAENEGERACVQEVGAQVIGYANADYHRWDMMRGLCRHWLSIERHLRQDCPLILKVWIGQKAPQRLL